MTCSQKTQATVEVDWLLLESHVSPLPVMRKSHYRHSLATASSLPTWNTWHKECEAGWLVLPPSNNWRPSRILSDTAHDGPCLCTTVCNWTAVKLHIVSRLWSVFNTKERFSGLCRGNIYLLNKISFVMLDFKSCRQLVSLAMKIKVLYVSQGHRSWPFISCNQRVALPTEVIFHSYNIRFSWLFVLQKVSLKPIDPSKAL